MGTQMGSLVGMCVFEGRKYRQYVIIGQAVAGFKYSVGLINVHP